MIIPCFNHAQYLAYAIESVIKQTYPHVEIIVVDDGSGDNTKEVAHCYSNVTYIYQDNSGLSAARNTGIDISTGDYLVFLDADDWLYPDALNVNVKYLRENPEAAFVSGAHLKVSDTGEILDDQKFSVEGNHYHQLLQGNYIGMHATVMYQRWVFNEWRYDVTLKACEDYDLYLKITRKYPVIHHQAVMAGYRIHNTNMSGNISLMLDTVLNVLKRQEPFLESTNEAGFYHNGFNVWKEYYTGKIFEKLMPLSHDQMEKSKNELQTLRAYSPRLYYKLTGIKIIMTLKKLAKRILLGREVPRPGTVDLGDLNRTTPFSTEFGYDRGGPVDRYYIENFLEQHKQMVKGNVLEIGDDEYTLRYGGAGIAKSNILHIDENNPKATYVGDLSDAPVLPDNTFDCIILTQTLHLIYDFKSALKTCYRVLKPGGVLLLTVPGITHIDQGQWKENWLWAFTGTAISKLLAEVFPPADIKVDTYGNVLVATAFLYGMGLTEMNKKKMDIHDPHYQVIISGFAKKEATN